tara:strand:+ start:286 stop:687 length:402 start_codon:yes stop_codon:yes gene_type:complete
MDLNILKYASETKNNKLLKKFDFYIKQKNSICGDIIEISIKLDNKKIKEIGFNCKSCVFTQASASILSNYSINKSFFEIIELKNFVMRFFENKEKVFPKKWSKFSKLINKKNFARKECLLLPLITMEKLSKKV